VLTGAAHTIKRRRPILYVKNDRKDRSAALLGMDYRLYWHLPPLFSLNNFFDESKNLFGNTVSVKVLGLPKEAKQDIKLSEIQSASDERPGGVPAKTEAAEWGGRRGRSGGGRMTGACAHAALRPKRGRL
jgi:hypothetical protein